MTIEYHAEFHRLFTGIIVEVCEGRGTEEDPKRLVYYVHTEDGVLLGRLDNLFTPASTIADGEAQAHGNIDLSVWAEAGKEAGEAVSQLCRSVLQR